jgi:lipopolysaccharide export system permease protein
LIKKLDILITKAFIGPFIATFFVTLLVLLMQFFWLWIDDFVGKGLPTSIILEFTWYQMATLVPLALPLAVLLSSLMTFGNLGESFELVAIKSAGISLLRFMRPVFFISILLCVLAFLFANNFMPVAQLKSKTLLRDIYNKQPAFELQEGVFYNKIPGFAIKVGRKEKDSLIGDVVIYERGGPLQDNFIVAKDGVMRITENRHYLEMILKDGWRYEERGDRYGPASDFIRLGFKEYKKQFDLSFCRGFYKDSR